MLIKYFIKGFFESSIPNEASQSKKQFMKRGKFFLYKYLFLIKTQRAMKMNIVQILKNFFTIFKLLLTTTKFSFDSRFGGTLYFVDNENLLNVFLAGGFDRSRVIVTGNPIYDEAFRKPSTSKNIAKDGKIHVLYAPSTNYEQGLWTRTQRDISVKEIVKKISENKQEMSLVVKIHPSFTILSQYQSLINPIDPSIPVYKNGSIQKFVEDADVVLSHLFTSADVYSLLARKPIILCNFFNSGKDPYVQKGLALECTNTNDLINIIHNALSPNPIYEQQRELFIKEFLYKGGGRATERICNEIIKLLYKNNYSNN
jgi:hypothetical protein